MSKQKKKKAKIIPFGSKISLPNYIKKHARKLPIHKCFIVEGYEYEANTFAYVFREKKNGDLILGVYLLNLWCRGLDESNFHEIKSYERLEAIEHFLNPDEAVEIVEIEAIKLFKLIYGSIAFAKKLGFEPHKTFKTTAYILDPEDTIDYSDMEFGDGGIPTLIAEDEPNLEATCAVLDKSVGSNGYKVIYNFFEEDPNFIADSRERFISLYAYSKYAKYKRISSLNNLMFEDDFELAKQNLRNPDDFKSLIKSNLINVEADPSIIENIENDMEVYLSALEKYIMFFGDRFLNEDIFIDCFNALQEEELEEIDFDEINLKDIDFDVKDFEDSNLDEDFTFPDNFESFSDAEKLDFFNKYLEDGFDGSDQEHDKFLNQMQPDQLFTNLINYTLLNTYGLNKLYLILNYYCEINQLDSGNNKHLKQVRETLEKFREAGANLSPHEHILLHHLAHHEEVFGKVDFETIIKKWNAENNL